MTSANVLGAEPRESRLAKSRFGSVFYRSGSVWRLSGLPRPAQLRAAWLGSALGAVACLLTMAPANAGSSSQEYVLGPQDTLRIRVYEWRPSTGTAYEWVPLTGEFMISASGNLSLPIIGSVSASGRTVDQVSETIGEELQRQIGLQKRPNASVEVSVYRPFFVTGAVGTPGKYSFIPGLTVVQALSMAGGTGSADPQILQLQHDALVSQGAVRELEVERISLAARQARVDAVLGDKVKISFPDDVASHASEPGVAKMMSEEQSLLDSRLRSVNTELNSISQSKILAKNQLDSLRLKEESLAKQIELASKDLNSINKLVSQGLTVSARQLGANQNVGDLESRNLDVALAIVKTQQDLAKLDQDALDVREKYRSNALMEASELRDRLSANDEKMRTARALLANVEMRAPGVLPSMDREGRPVTLTKISRAINGVIQTFLVKDDDAVIPGDVIRVERRDKPGSGSLASGEESQPPSSQ